MTKRFRLSPLQSVMGTPLRIPARDESGAVLWEQPPADGFEGKPQVVEADLAKLLYLLGLTLPPGKITMRDSIQARELFECLRKAENSTLELGEGLHDWLKQTVETYGTALLGINACVLKDALDNFERAKGQKPQVQV